MAASIPLITADGNKFASPPALIRPKTIWNNPAMTRLTKNPLKLPVEIIAAATTVDNPAAGPETLNCEPLNNETRIPPTIPANRPD